MLYNLTKLAASLIVAAFFLGGATDPASAQAQGEYAVFNDHDPQSTTKFLYQDWDQFLHALVFDVGPSNRYRISFQNKGATGRRLSGGSSRSASWLEGNRLRLHLLVDTTPLFLKELEAGMVQVAEDNDIAKWNRDEQLAYWLNLHNLLVMQVVAENYPYVSFKKLRRMHWTRNMVTVKGVALSIQEIQDEIILAIWHDPMVIYGLFQASIGGPGLRPLALRGDKIQLSLQTSGVEFVNSYRGVHSWGKTAKASEFYKWTARAFPDFEADLRSHLSSLADEKTAAILKRTSKVRANYFSWTVPDFYGGRMSDYGSASNAASLTAIQGTSLERFTGNSELISGGVATAAIPAHVLAFLTAMRRKFKIFKMSNEGISNREMLTGVSSPRRR